MCQKYDESFIDILNVLDSNIELIEDDYIEDTLSTICFGRDDDDNAAFPVNDFDNYGVEQPA